MLDRWIFCKACVFVQLVFKFQVSVLDFCVVVFFCFEVSVLDERLCDFKKWHWTPFDEHIDRFNLTEMGTGKVIRMLINDQSDAEFDI